MDNDIHPKSHDLNIVVPPRRPGDWRASAKNQIHRCLLLERHHSQDRRRNTI
jgi:hypothetical protein